MASKDIDVLVVGAGPVGLIAALVLAQSGVSIRVINKAGNIEIGQRGAGLVPRTQESLYFLGVLDDFLRDGGRMPHLMHFYENGEFQKAVPFSMPAEPTPQIPFPKALALGQDRNCAILRAHLDALGVPVEFNTELVTFEQDDAGVSATIKAGAREETVRSKFLLGTDGARGVTRRIAGINFVGKTDDIRSIIGDVELSGIGEEYVLRNYTDEKGNRLLIRPIPDDPTLFFFVYGGPDVGEHAAAAMDRAGLQALLRRVTDKPELVVDKIRTIADWRLNERVADKFQVGRVLIAGDAAHCHSPAGGQGLNSGVMDAMNVAWKLALAAKGRAPPALLDSYEDERMPVIREMLRMTSALLAELVQNANAGWSRPLSLRQLGIHCRWSALVRDEARAGALVVRSTNVEPEDVYGDKEAGGLCAGDRAPDAPGLAQAGADERVRLFELFAPTRHTVLVFDAAAVDKVRALVGAYPEGTVRVVAVLAPGDEERKSERDAYIDTQGHAHGAYGAAAGVTIVVVRPDGVVGGLLRSTEGIRLYFTKIFA